MRVYSQVATVPDKTRKEKKGEAGFFLGWLACPRAIDLN